MALKLKKNKQDDADGEHQEVIKPGRAAKKPAKKLVGIKKGGKEKRFVLLIGDEGAILVFMEGPKVVRRLFAMTPQPAHTEAILNLLQTNPKVPISILVDNIDQQFVRQSFPPVSSLSVNGLVQRRIDRDFQSEDMNGYLPLGRDKDGRKEWHFLLISLAKTTALSDWIDLIIELPTPLSGIYLVPVEATLYLPILYKSVSAAPAHDWQLLVTHNKVSGFRQVVTYKGKLAFTRVTQAMDDAIPAVTAGNIEQEIINTIEYLKRLEFENADGLDIIVVAAAEVNESLDLKRFNLGNTDTLTPLDVANALGLEQAALSADRFGDVVMASAFLRTQKRVLKFSTAYAKSLDKLYTAKKALKAGTALVAVLLLGLSVQNILGSLESSSLAETSNSKRQALKDELSKLQKKVEGLDKNVAFKSAVVSTYDAYIKPELRPNAFVSALMPNLTPEQRVLSMEWNTTTSSATKAAGAPTPPPSTMDKDAGPTLAKVEFEFKGNYVDLDNLAKSVNSFMDKLKTAMPQYTITHDPFPWEKEKGKGLEISFDQQQSGGAIQPGNDHITILFSGPKKLDPAAPATGGMNPAPHPVGMLP
jgi:hypothetical protein